MSNRFGRDTSRNSLFSNYDARSTSPSKQKSQLQPHAQSHRSPVPPTSGGGYGYGYPVGSGSGSGSGSQPQQPHISNSSSPSFSAYPGAANGRASADGGPAFRSATPNSRGQYSASVLDELESQNDEHVGILTGKVRELKNLTHLINHEIRDSSALAEKMNDQFENSRLKIKGTMNRMLRMAQRTGVGWKVWLIFFACVIVLFWWVWLF